MPDPAASATPDVAAGVAEPTTGVVREFPRPTPESPYLNRELSWLEFNHRVLALADVADTPVLERAKFLAIFASNLDEFFQVRVAILKEQEAARLGGSSPDGLTPDGAAPGHPGPGGGADRPSSPTIFSERLRAGAGGGRDPASAAGTTSTTTTGPSWATCSTTASSRC